MVSSSFQNSANTQQFSFKTNVFEGPLELLIELVEKRKLLINDISLAAVTDEYIERVTAMQEQSLPHTAHFVVLAATLLLIKSKSLLPTLELTSEEEGAIDDLEERLQRYQIFRRAADVIAASFGHASLYTPELTPPRVPIFKPDHYCSQFEMAEAMTRVLANLPKPEIKPPVHVKPTISLEAMMERLKTRIEQQFKMSFFDLTRSEPERKVIIVGFLAILELIKQGNVLVMQTERFADIYIEQDQQETPRYY
jgi:segregation and condensation protein A